MKIQIVFLAVLGLAFGKPPTHVSLEDDLKELKSFFPTKEILVIALDYLHHDREVKELVEYIQSEEFPMIHSIIEHLKEYTESKVPCFKFFNEHGFDVYEIVHHLHHLLHLPPYEPTNRTYMGVGLHGLYEDMHSVLPFEEMKAHLHKKMESRDYLKTLVKFSHSPLFMSWMEKVKSWPEYHKLHKIVREKCSDLHHIHELLKELHWRGIQIVKVELKEFIPLDPTAEIFDILLDYLTHDPELKEFFLRIQSKEFPKIHKGVEHVKKYKELYLPCLKYIDEHGVDVYAIVHELHLFISEIRVSLGLPPLEPTHTTRMGVGLPGLIEDIINVLPLDKLKVLIEKKLETHEHFKILYTLIHSYEIREMVHVLQDLSEYHELVEFLRKISVDEGRIFELLRTLFSLPPF